MEDGSNSSPMVIMGAGLVGSLLGCYLSQRGYKVHIYERREDMRKVNISAGRSINLALSERGITSLAGVGLRDDVMKIAIPMKGRMMHAVDGKLTFQPYSKDEKQCIYSISRGELNCKLMTLAEQRAGVQIHFNQKCLDVDIKNGQIQLEDEITKQIKTVQSQRIFGADGAYSAVRTAMMKLPRFDYSQSYLTHGYKELHLPPGANGEHQIEKNCLHIWPRGSLMMIALPNMDGSFTVTCFFPFNGPDGFDYLDHATDDQISSYFKKNFGDAYQLMPTLVDDFKANPTSSLVTIRCFPWSYRDTCVLFGDAAHAIVPFFGQGMNAGFEDCRIFDEILTQLGTDDWEKVFKAFEQNRKKDADAIADMALENFIEMRDKVADKHFLFNKKVQHKLGNEFPGRFLSRYELVSFTVHPYSEAVRLGLLGDKLTEELMADLKDDDLTKLDMTKAKELMDKYFPTNIL